MLTDRLNDATVAMWLELPAVPCRNGDDQAHLFLPPWSHRR